MDCDMQYIKNPFEFDQPVSIPSSVHTTMVKMQLNVNGWGCPLIAQNCTIIPQRESSMDDVYKK